MNKYFFSKITNIKKKYLISINSHKESLLKFKSFIEKKTKDIKSGLILELKINVLKKFINLESRNQIAHYIKRIFWTIKTSHKMNVFIKYYDFFMIIYITLLESNFLWIMFLTLKYL